MNKTEILSLRNEALRDQAKLERERDELLAQAESCCEWTNDDTPDMDGTWDGSCGTTWSFIDGGPTENNMRFCPECGKHLKVMP